MPGSFVAEGTIRPMRIVKHGTTAGLVAEATGVTDDFVGISGQGTRFAPWDELDDGNHAIVTENVVVKQDGEKRVKLELGGTVTIGQWVTSHTDGTGLASTTDRDNVVGKARMGGVAGEIIEVDIIIGERSTA